MCFVGFLFGLGLDTVSEVGLLELSARSGQTGVPFWVIMLGVYGWAFVKPIREAYYNLIVTALFVVVALVVAT